MTRSTNPLIIVIIRPMCLKRLNIVSVFTRGVIAMWKLVTVKRTSLCIGQQTMMSVQGCICVCVGVIVVSSIKCFYAVGWRLT